jgi:hypothetical protein
MVNHASKEVHSTVTRGRVANQFSVAERRKKYGKLRTTEDTEEHRGPGATARAMVAFRSAAIWPQLHVQAATISW